MNDKIDVFFRNKLEKQETLPSAAAWQKLQGQLNGKKRNKYAFFYKIAAVFLFLSIFTFTFISLNKNTGNPVSEKTDETFKNPLPEGNNINLSKAPPASDSEQHVTQIADEEQQNLNPPQLVENKDLIVKNKINKIVKKPLILIENEAIAHSIPNDDMDISDSETGIKKQVTRVTPEDQNPYPGITITYKKGNKKQLELAEKTNDENDNNTLKKLLKMAKELKYSEISLADLRDSKEELFGLEITKQKNN